MTAERSYQFTSAAPPYGASYGETFIEQGGHTYDNPYIPTSVGRKELDEETGLYYYGARYYDPMISLWLSVDPLAGVNPDKTPYNYTSNNPVVRIDPTGMVDNPIYGTDGTFLGTDDKGLQGEMIVMNKEDFKQGMSHEEAMKLNKGIDGFLNPDIANQALEHYKKLPKRPDYDGIVTKEEADYWRQNGNGQPLFVDISKMNFKSSALTVNDLKQNKGVFVNFFGIDIHAFNKNVLWRPSSDHTLSWVFGTIKIKLLNSETGEIDLVRGMKGDPEAFDRYDFNSLDKPFAPNGKPFYFRGYNHGHVNLPFPPVNPLGGYFGSKF